MSGIVADLQHLLSHYGYWAVLTAIFLEDFGVPLPGESILIAAALEAAGPGSGLHIVPLLLVSWIAAVVGDNVGYAIGRFGGRALVLRYGRIVGLTPARWNRAEVRFRGFGPFVVVIARFVEVLRQLNGILAGILPMPWLTFLAFNALGAALWVGFWGTLAYQLGERITSIGDVFRRYEWYILSAVFIAFTLWLFIRFAVRRRGGRRDTF